MELRQLRALVAVVDIGSVTGAAEVLHLVQPAVTRHIRALERELGVELFERSRRGMTPTEAGRSVAERARRALAELERARVEVSPEPGQLSGLVRVGLLESTAEVLAESLTRAVAERHPGIRLTILSAYSGHLQQWLDDGDLDVTLLYNVENAPTLHVRPLVREAVWAAAAPSAGLSPDLPVSIAEVARHPLVAPSSGHGLRALIDAAMARAGVEITPVLETDSAQIQRHLARAGIGWTVLPAVAVATQIRAGILSGAPLAEPAIHRDLLLALPRSGRTPAAVGAVAHELVSAVDDAIRSGAWPSARLLGAHANGSS